MVGHVGLGESREASATPVKITTINDDTTDTGSVSADVFRCRVNYDISTVFEWAI